MPFTNHPANDPPALMSATLPTYDQCLKAKYLLDVAADDALVAYYTRDPYHIAKVKDYLGRAAAELGAEVTWPTDLDLRAPREAA